ncbi:DUF429 domain-containing protein [Actinomycetospora chlora]|uniref:DUF429 domain-containing protein n=1 Tax=Actinomycetospora chlora TaxID=663608 RepID=A0ABP9AVN3_9PSEU
MGDTTSSITVGIDMASQDVGTAICRIRWDGRSATVERLSEGGTGNEEIVSSLLEVPDGGWAGVDSPFGWPEHFVDAVTAHRAGRPWPDRGAVGPESIRRLRYRETDLHVRRRCGFWPRSVSSELIALLAMRWAGILDALHLETGHPVDRSGAGPVVEVYPSAALKQWGLPRRGYKGGPMDPSSRRLRFRILHGIQERLGCLVMTPATARRLLADDDALDAFVCALAARAAQVGAVEAVPSERHAAAAYEGWIVLPVENALERLVDARVPS